MARCRKIPVSRQDIYLLLVLSPNIKYYSWKTKGCEPRQSLFEGVRKGTETGLMRLTACAQEAAEK